MKDDVAGRATGRARPTNGVLRDVGIAVGFAAVILTGLTAGMVWEAKNPEAPGSALASCGPTAVHADNPLRRVVSRSAHQGGCFGQMDGLLNMLALAQAGADVGRHGSIRNGRLGLPAIAGWGDDEKVR
jgi:hypothetical protein